MNGKIYGVAIGPGDPDLITLKALKTLKESDIIFFPGSIMNGKKKSHSLNILNHYNLDSYKLKGIYLPMNFDRSLVEKEYDNCFNQIVEYYQQGLTISFVSEGDIMFFSTFSYILNKIKETKLNVEIIPGVPAFISAGSIGKFPICLQFDKVLIVPALKDTNKLKKLIVANETVIVMKLSTLKNDIVNFLKEEKPNFFYGENLGTEKEFTTTEVEKLINRKIPYFSILILNKYIN